MSSRTTRVSLTRLGLLHLQLHQAERAISELTAMGCRPIEVRCGTYDDAPLITVVDPKPVLADLDRQPEVHQQGTFREARASWRGVTVAWLAPHPEKRKERGRVA